MSGIHSSTSFDLLDRRIQYWIWQNNWEGLRDIQERGIPAILAKDRDVILSAATASGKTEAAFHPILTHMLNDKEGIGLTIYISPLIALINDQYRRLLELCESLEMPVHPWHGGIAASKKKKFYSQPEGVLLITPESLEALFCNHGEKVRFLFAKLQYIVIDELHAFIGTERGKQLQTLMHLIELAAQRRIPRIALSATLGDMSLAAHYLRRTERAEVIDSKTPMNLKILLKGYVRASGDEDIQEDEVKEIETRQIVKYLFPILRKSNNLVFPNSRANVEYYTKLFSEQCAKNKCMSQFFPHHGNLSHTIREEAEEIIKNSVYPTTIVCTNTLELGIDIGSVESIVQIGAPPSVSSLRQRLGRSGREEGSSSILRGFVTEYTIDERSDLYKMLREKTFEFCAMINLLLKEWCEPPKAHALNLSTLVQQILALISQHGGISIARGYQTLCETGPFNEVTKDDFIELLRSMRDQDLIFQDSTGALFHGTLGERFVNHYSFYTAFETEKEYQIVFETKTLGTLPARSMMQSGDYILFAGKAWVITDVDDKKRIIQVTPQTKGDPPPFFGVGTQLDTAIRKGMREIYEGTERIPYADAQTQQFIQEGRETYQRYNLKHTDFAQTGSSTYLFTWLGDDVNEAIKSIFKWQKIDFYSIGMAIVFTDIDIPSMQGIIRRLQELEKPNSKTLLQNANNLERQKWDWALSRTLLEKSYESSYMDIDAAWNWIMSRQFSAF